MRKDKGYKYYELSNHLGNVLTVVTDRKYQVDDNYDYTTDRFSPDIVSTTDYYAFGQSMPGRTWSSTTEPSYSFGFNGKTKDIELKGNDNSYDFGARLYDPRTGRWGSVDPLVNKMPFESGYSFAENNPIVIIDYGGMAPIPFFYLITFQWKTFFDIFAHRRAEFTNTGNIVSGWSYAENNAFRSNGRPPIISCIIAESAAGIVPGSNSPELHITKTNNDNLQRCFNLLLQDPKSTITFTGIAWGFDSPSEEVGRTALELANARQTNAYHQFCNLNNLNYVPNSDGNLVTKGGNVQKDRFGNPINISRFNFEISDDEETVPGALVTANPGVKPLKEPATPPKRFYIGQFFKFLFTRIEGKTINGNKLNSGNGHSNKGTNDCPKFKK